MGAGSTGAEYSAPHMLVLILSILPLDFTFIPFEDPTQEPRLLVLDAGTNRWAGVWSGLSA